MNSQDRINRAAGNDRVTGGSYMPCSVCGNALVHADWCKMRSVVRPNGWDEAKAMVDKARGQSPTDAEIMALWCSKSRYPEGNGNLCGFVREALEKWGRVVERDVPSDAEIDAWLLDRGIYIRHRQDVRDILAKFAAPPEDASDGDLFSWKDFYVDRDGMLVIKFQPVIRVPR